jgi:hypothetical protein
VKTAAGQTQGFAGGGRCGFRNTAEFFLDEPNRKTKPALESPVSLF